MAIYLLTGAAGFIGSHTARLLLGRGDEVIGIDNLNNYYDPALKRHRLAGLKLMKGFSFIGGDIENLAELDAIFSKYKFDAVINLAARAGVRYSIENPHVYATTNFNATLNLLEMMRKHDVRKFVLASSSSLYAGEETPFTEDLPVNKPISPYAATKKAAEMIAYSYHSLFGIDVSALRYFTVYGPAGRPDMSYFRFITSIGRGRPIEIYGDGSQTRDFTFVDDIARGTAEALRPLGYEVINLGGGRKPVSINYMIEIIEKLLGKKAVIEYKKFHEADMKETGADISKAGRLLGWSPEVDIEQGLETTVRWFGENAALIKDLIL